MKKFLFIIATFATCSLLTVWAVNSMHPHITVHAETRWPLEVRTR